MEITIDNLANLEETNTFLRALWAEIRREFGKCVWLYQPYKDGSKNLIYVGMMDIGVGTPIEVSLKYRTKSSISTIIFGNQSDSQLLSKSETGSRLGTVVTSALKQL